MRKKWHATWLVLLCFLLCRLNAFAQCPPSGTAWMEKITAIETSDAGVSDRIVQFEALQSLHQRCGAAKDSIIARILHRLGDLYRQTGAVEKGIRFAKEAVVINNSGRPGAQKAFLAHSWYNLGLYYLQLYLFAESNNYFDSCITIGIAYPPKNFIALLAYEQKAFSFHQAADYQKAVETADNGILLATQLQDTLSAAYILLQKAQSQLALNMTGDVEKNLRQVIRVLSRDNASPDYLATSYSVYAQLLTIRKEPRQAADYYRKAYALNKRQKNIAQCARDMIDLGYLYDYDLHDPRPALASYQEGLRWAQQANDAYLQAGLYNNIGIVYWRQKNFRQALHYYQQGLNVLPFAFKDTAISSNPSAAMLQLTGNNYFVYTLLANKGEALLDLHQQTNNKILLTWSLQTFRMADHMVDQMRWKQYSDQSKLFWREQTKKLYEKAIETCYQLHNPEAAFFFFEKSRAVLLNDKLNELGARKYLPGAQLRQEGSLRVRLLSLQQQLAATDGNGAVYNDLRQQLFTAQQNLDKFIKDLEKRYPAYYQYKYDTSSLNMTQLRPALQQRSQSLVEYFNGDSAIYILTVSPTTLQLDKIVFPDYSTMARELMGIVSDKSLLNRQYARYRALAYQLYDTLFRKLPVSTNRVIISPDDHFIPFELLLTDPAGNNHFLLKQHAFSYTYSATFLWKGAAHKQPPGSRLLGMAPVNYQSHLQQPALAGADRSLQTIGSYFTSATIFTHEQATKKQFLVSLPQYAVVQLYSHADADSTGQEPVLYLEDSTLKLTELQGLANGRTRLIVLAACNTGVGKNIRGEGVFSLARGFAAAGIPATVTNVWPVENEATYQVTELFYKYLHEGLPGDEALQRAKLDFLQSSDRTQELPYYWAASLFIGNAEIIQQETSNKNTVLLWAGGALLLFVLLWIVIRSHKRKP